MSRGKCWSDEQGSRPRPDAAPRSATSLTHARSSRFDAFVNAFGALLLRLGLLLGHPRDKVDGRSQVELSGGGVDIDDAHAHGLPQSQDRPVCRPIRHWFCSSNCQWSGPRASRGISPSTPYSGR